MPKDYNIWVLLNRFQGEDDFMKKLLLCVCVIGCVFFISCSKLNPFASPDLNIIEENIEYSEFNNHNSDQNDALKKNEIITEENANAFSKRFFEKTEDIYYRAFDKYFENNNKNKNDEPFIKVILIDIYTYYKYFGVAAPFILLGSLCFGIIGALFSRYNKGVRRFFIVAFVITIPLLVFVFYFGIGILNSIFLYN